MKKILILLTLMGVCLQAKPTVSVSILPQKYFIKQIAKDTLHVNTLVQKGSSPATYEPKPAQMVALSKSDIYFAIGVPYERVWVKKFKQINPNLNIVQTDKGIKKLHISAHHHEHEKAHEHSKDEILDPHIWLDPKLVKLQVKTMTDALMKTYPKHKAFYEKNLNLFLKNIDALDEKIAKLLKGKKGKKFLVYHPSWGYFAHRYGLKQEAIEIEGKKPKPKDLMKIIDEAKKDKVSVIFVQPQFSKKSAQLIASAIKGRVEPIDQLDENWESGLLKSATILSKSLR